MFFCLEFEPKKIALFQILPVKSTQAAKTASHLISLPQAIVAFTFVSPTYLLLRILTLVKLDSVFRNKFISQPTIVRFSHR
jgi:hypothetical protein